MNVFEISFRGGPKRVCRVRAGTGALDRLVKELVADPPGSLLVVVSDSNVAPLHGARLARRLGREGFRAELLTFPAGEASKTRETKAALEDRLLQLEAGRDSALIAVGGGVTGDLAGFVAATWNRGVPVVQVPTSLLSMVDAALGGKTAVNLQGGKNLIGAFHQPWGVYADVETLSTQADVEFRDGFAEAVKSAAIADLKLFRWLEQSVEPLLARDRAALAHLVATCLRIKGRIVMRDERDVGRRAELNFGHTVAHAVETATGHAISHGRAVAVGMCIEARLAVGTCGFPAAHLRRLESLLRAFGLPTKLPDGVSTDAVIEATRIDKKTREGRARYALPARLGRMPAGERLTVPLGPAALREALQIDLSSAAG